jgi:hypothetical protein
VQFGLQFKQAEADGSQAPMQKAPTAATEARKAKAAGGAPGEVVTLDSFRKK